LGVIESTCEEEQIPGVQLQGEIVGQQIRGANILSQRVAEISAPQECFGEPDAHITRAGVDGTRVSVLDCGLGVLASRHVPISAVKKALSRGCRVPLAGAAQREDAEQRETPG
jgi:hypothetical protein